MPISPSRHMPDATTLTSAHSIASLLTSYKTVCLLLSISALMLPWRTLYCQADISPDTGVHEASTYVGDSESISPISGNVNIRIPLISLPQRGGKILNIGATYNSNIWGYDQANGYWYAAGSSQNVSGAPAGPVYFAELNDGMTGWNLDLGLPRIYWTTYDFPGGSCYVGNVLVLMPDGSQHQFNNMNYDCTDGGPNPKTALDLEGFYSLTLNDSAGVQTLQDADGNVYTLHQSLATPGSWTPPGNYTTTLLPNNTLLFDTFTDPNGNQISKGSFPSNLIDTMGRAITVGIPLSSKDGNYWITLTAGSDAGANNTFLLYFSPLAVTPSIPNGSGHNGTATVSVLTKILLPNNTSYSMSYDAWGELTKIEYPTGGYTSYDYQTYSLYDVPFGRYAVAKHNCSSSAGSCSGPALQTTSLAYTWGANDAEPITTQNWVGRTFQSVVTYPDLHTESIAIANNSASTNEVKTITVKDNTGKVWRTITQQLPYSPDVSALLCLVEGYTECYVPLLYEGLYYIPGTNGLVDGFPISETTTLDNGQQSTIQYSYVQILETLGYPPTTYTQLVATRNIGSMTENDFTGHPVRLTNIAYYQSYWTSAVSMFHLPYSVEVFNNTLTSGTNANWSLLAETTLGYDESTLTNPGASVQHGASYGATYRTRGNVTSKAMYQVPGSTYVKESITYDIYGNPITETDYNGNPTSYSYADEFAGSNALCMPSPGTPTFGYLTQVKNALNQPINLSYYPCTGKVASIQDPNDQASGRAGVQYKYDFMGNGQAVNLPDGGSTSINYNNYSIPLTVTATTVASPDPSVVTSYVYDGYGRVTQAQLAWPNQTTLYRDITYDWTGRQSTTSTPYLTSADQTYGLTTYTYDALGRLTRLTNPDSTALTASYVGTSVAAYDEGLSVNGVSKALGRISQFDALGRIISICELATASQQGVGAANVTPNTNCDSNIPGKGFVTTYTYDGLDNLTSVVQGGTNRYMYYNALSQLVGVYDPEKGAAMTGSMPCGSIPALANTAWCYDANGNIASKTSIAPNPQPSNGGISYLYTATYSYDKLNRLTSVSYADANPNNYAHPTPTRQFIYDSPISGWGLTSQHNTIGRLSAAYELNNSSAVIAGTALGYDPTGRVNVLAECTIDDCGSHWYYEMLYSYDLDGMRTQDNLLAGPSETGFEINKSYNSIGRLSSASSTLTGATYPATIASNMQYSPLGRLGALTFGNGAQMNRYFDKRGNIDCEVDATTSSTLYSYVISSADPGCPQTTSVSGYSPNGSIVAVNDSVNGFWKYGYDEFNRINSASATSGPWSGQHGSWLYDRFGNQWNQTIGSMVKAAIFTGNGSGNNNTIDGSTYDLAGNLLTDGLNSFSYDDDGNIVGVLLGSGSSISYTYNGFGRPVRRQLGTVISEYIYDVEGNRIGDSAPGGSINDVEVFGDGEHLATYDFVSQGLYFIHSDWLGTERVRSRYDGINYEACSSLPYGDEMTCTFGQGLNGATDPSTMHFTGMPRDPDSQLDVFSSRSYSSLERRWLHPDLPFADQDLMDPQTWNLYSYANNNPINGIDTNGLDVYLIGGTHYKASEWAPGSVIWNQMQSLFPGQEIHVIPWSGGLSRVARSELASSIVQVLKNLPPGPNEFVLHSHAGNAMDMALSTLRGEEPHVHVMITLGQPMRPDYKGVFTNIDYVFNIYAGNDLVQKLGGIIPFFGGRINPATPYNLKVTPRGNFLTEHGMLHNDKATVGDWAQKIANILGIAGQGNVQSSMQDDSSPSSASDADGDGQYGGFGAPDPTIGVVPYGGEIGDGGFGDPGSGSDSGDSGDDGGDE